VNQRAKAAETSRVSGDEVNDEDEDLEVVKVVMERC